MSQTTGRVGSRRQTRASPCYTYICLTKQRTEMPRLKEKTAPYRKSSDNASKRKAHAEHLRQEDLRKKIASGLCLREVREMEVMIRKWAAENGDDAPEPTQIQAAKLYLDSKWRRLSKLLPDLKAVEHVGDVSGQIEHNINVNFTGVPGGGSEEP